MFGLFDVDKNGLVSKTEFVKLLNSKLPESKPQSVASERARRNLDVLSGHMKWTQTSPESLLQLADKDRNYTIDLKEFHELLIGKLGFQVSVEEVKEMFYVIDSSNNCLLYTSPSPRDLSTSRMPSSA